MYYYKGVCVPDPYALIDAVLARDGDRVNALKRAGKHDIDVVDERGNTALSRESYQGNFESVTLLVQAGADVNIKNI
jgi:ankyrin repeat protein